MSRNNEPAKALGKKSMMDRYVGWFVRWMPDSMAIILLMTFVLAIVIKFATGSPFIFSSDTKTSILNAWTDGFWALLTFSMQMTLVMVTGYIVSNVGIVKKGLLKLAELPNNEFQANLLSMVAGTLMSWVHWGLGTMTSIVLGRQILALAKTKKGYKIHLPLYLGMGVMRAAFASHGLSQAPALMATTPGAMAQYVPDAYKDKIGLVPMTQTVLSPQVLISIVILLLSSFVFYFLLRPKRQEDYKEISDEFCEEILNAGKVTGKPEMKDFATFMNNSPLLTTIIGGFGLVWCAMSLSKTGIIGLSINTFNLLMLCLGLVLSGSPAKFSKIAIESMSNVWGVVVQFPLYAGLFGLITYTGFAGILTNFFLNIATTKTFPVIVFIYSAIINMMVPSGGSKFIIELPYILPAGIELGVPLWKVINSYTWGDLTTNIIQPFWLLPTIAMYKTKFSELMPYGLIFCAWALIFHAGFLLIFY
ncbi:TIGR00366 family protein [Ruminococcaceae bacterium OttesenSCG-928-O06]|nr:TIGR00366 family protein [Ruminococcaceae bacterium OttesenSCG-928-O06]